MEMILYACVHSFSSMCTILRSEEGKSPEAVDVMETIVYTCVPRFTSMCAILASLRSEEVILKKIAWGYFLVVFVMETIEYMCVLSFTSMCAILSKLRSKLLFVGGCHGND